MKALVNGVCGFRGGGCRRTALVMGLLALLSTPIAQAQRVNMTERAEEVQKLCSNHTPYSGLDCGCLATKFMAFDVNPSQDSLSNILNDLMRTDVTECVVPEQVSKAAMKACNDPAAHRLGMFVNNHNLSQDELCECLSSEMVKLAQRGAVHSGRVIVSDAIMACGM